MIEVTDGEPIETVGAVLSMVVVPPVKGALLTLGVRPLALARFKPIVPSPVPVLTVTV